MSVINHVTIMGNLGQDPELRYTAKQKPCLRLSVATTERKGGKTPAGQKPEEETHWHTIIVWGDLGPELEKFLRKGDTVHLEGKIKYRAWEKDGVKHRATEIHTFYVSKIQRRPRRDQAAQPKADPSRSTEEPTTAFNGEPDVDPDQIPF